MATIPSGDHAHGLELARAGRIGEAEVIFRRLLAADPVDPEALHFLGVLSAQKSDLPEAERYLRLAVEARPDWAKAWNSLGSVLHIRGKAADSVAACGEAVRLEPASDELLYNFGLALQAAGKLQEAADALRKATVAAPASSNAFCALGAVLRDLSLFGEAEAACRRAIEIDPRHAEACNQLGITLRRQGRHADAEAAYRRAIELKPDIGHFHGNLASILRIRGELAEAEAAYRRSVELDPTHTEAYRMLAELATIAADDPLMVRMRELSRSGGLPADRQIDLHFALGKALESQRDYEAAFHHWEAGNRLKRLMLDYDDNARDAAAQEIISVVDGDLLKRHAGTGCPSAAPIFVIGMPRSGTTLVEQILASHSAVQAGSELSVLLRLARSAGYPAAFADPDPAALKAMGEAYLAEVGLADSPHFTDKLPANFLRVGLIRLILPNARIIHCRRDPVDTCLSCYRQNFRGSRQPYAYDLRELALEYRRYERVMAHWNVVAPGAVYDVQYETLIDDQEGETRRLLEHCRLPFEDACLRFHETRRTVGTASASQVRRPIYSTSSGRWRRYEAQLEPLLAILRA